jgi:hypothetical protein
MAVTTNYLYPVTGSIPPFPNPYNTVVVTIQGGAASDTSAQVSHNFNLPASDISFGFPELDFVQQVNEVTQGIWELSENPNFTIFGLAGVVGPVKVFIHRPHSIVR